MQLNCKYISRIGVGNKAKNSVLNAVIPNLFWSTPHLEILGQPPHFDSDRRRELLRLALRRRKFDQHTEPFHCYYRNIVYFCRLINPKMELHGETRMRRPCGCFTPPFLISVPARASPSFLQSVQARKSHPSLKSVSTRKFPKFYK